MECVAGSTLYNLNTPTSDLDVRGIFMVPNKDRLSLVEPPGEVADKTHDITFYELNKFMHLAADVNPNIIELLFIPSSHLTFHNDKYRMLSDNADLFISKKAKHSFTGYAYAQIKRAKGKNKKVHNTDMYLDTLALETLEQLYENNEVDSEWISCRFNKHILTHVLKHAKTTEDEGGLSFKDQDKHLDLLRGLQSPRREEFCHGVGNLWMDKQMMDCMQPFRPKAVEDMCFMNLDHCDCSSVEHMANLYRIYRNGTGVFKDNQLTFKSISKEREWEDFIGVMSYNENEYDKAKREYVSFWEWYANRNEQRWETQIGGSMDYDAKNMLHCVRLLYSAINIAKEGKPLIRFEGKEQEFLMDIRSGKYDYDYLIKLSEDLSKEAIAAFDCSPLPDSVNRKKINDLYQNIIGY